MCGICGFTWRDAKQLDSMVQLLQHRGPDGSGSYVDERVSIGHTRLSIIDLSDAGRQPMASADGDVVISYNGEIYNFKDLRQQLEMLGYVFYGTSDTEVLLNAYLEWGVNAFAKFNGMWAVCIYDKPQRKLILSRDRIGVKPLYFSYDEGKLIFASEIKAILTHPISRKINRAAVDMLLSTQFVPSPLTLFRAIAKVEPREYLVYDFVTGQLEKNCYYEIPRYEPQFNKRRLLEEGRKLLEDSVRIRLVADVPLGAFLSGGVDSSTVVAVMKNYVSAEHLNTVSVGFDLPGLDESEFIGIAQRAFSTRHHHIVFRTKDTALTMEHVFKTYDEPVADPSSFPMYSLCEETRRWMTVALSGDGGDEIFGGYEDRRVVAQFCIIRKVPRVIRRLLHLGLATLYGYNLTTLGKLAEALRVSLLDPSEYAAEIGASLVYRPEAFKTWARTKLKDLLERSRGDLVEAMLKFDIYFNRLGDNYAAKVDRMSMAHSIEVRSPFLDYRFMEFASRIPVKWKITSFSTKILMKGLVKGLIPDQILKRQKHGFAGPLGAWIDENDDLLRSAVETLFDRHIIDENWYSFFRNKVFVSNHPIFREYKKRLFFLWRWQETWLAEGSQGVPAVGATASVG
jgi:asparagine synthase (glutamine-hydrolysing)